ncbi:MAG: DUF4058 family protein [Cyanobacteria bacterium P01_D01_bin.105]
MGSPFPGMNPYLENPTTWPNLHSRLIVAIANVLGPQVRPKYRVVVEEAVYKRDEADQAILIGVPDVSVRQSGSGLEPREDLYEGNIAIAKPESVTVTVPMPDIVRHRYLEIRSLRTSNAITVIEILSPVNKRGIGRQKYDSKRLEILDSQTNLIEIDLLHEGQPMPVLNYEQHSHYRILVSESSERPQAQLYPFNLQQPIPAFWVPLKAEDPAIVVELKPLLDELYELSGYDLDIDYSQDPMPKWPATEVTWIDQQLKLQQLR